MRIVLVAMENQMESKVAKQSKKMFRVDNRIIVSTRLNKRRYEDGMMVHERDPDRLGKPRIGNGAERTLKGFNDLHVNIATLGVNRRLLNVV